MKIDKYIGSVLALALLIHVMTAINSVGFAHPDEHYQILEFLNWRWLGGPREVLSWEFVAQMRPWLQPWLYAGVIHGLQGLGFDNPFIWTLALRLGASLLGLFSAAYLALKLAGKHCSSKVQALYLSVALLVWYIPFIHARASSENLSASFLFLALGLFLDLSARIKAAANAVGSTPIPTGAEVTATEALLASPATGAQVLAEKKENHFIFWALAGVCAGVAFQLRYQSAVVAGTMLVWGLLNKQWRASGVFALSALLISLLILLVDCYGYGEWVLAPWNYFEQNILADKASQFGRDPWWFYLKATLIQAGPPLSVLLILGSLAFCWFYPRHLLTLAFLGFWFLHQLVAHKELRFIYFMGLLAPLLALHATLQYRGFRSWWRRRNWPRRVLIALALVNGFAVLAMSWRPAHTPLVIYRYLYEHFPEQQIVYIPQVKGQVTPLDLSLPFYLRPGVRTQMVDLVYWVGQPVSEAPILTSTYQDYEQLIGLRQCRVLIQTYPKWLFKLNFFNWMSRSSIWTLWQCGG